MEKATVEFQYGSALDEQSIRLLRFEPTNPDAQSKPSPDIELHLETFPIEDLPPYHALSYTWGPALPGLPDYTDGDKMPVRVGGCLFNVYPNLLRALRWMWATFEWEGNWLWVDAICINQDDLGERAAQVSIMDTIYSGVSETLVWLGEADADTPTVNKVFGTILGHPIKTIDEALSTFRPGQSPDDEVMQGLGLPTFSGEQRNQWVAVARFFERRWWSRVWVFQEAVLSKRLMLGWGSTCLEWGQLRIVALTLMELGVGSAWLSNLAPADRDAAREVCSPIDNPIAMERQRWMLHEGADRQGAILSDVQRMFAIERDKLTPISVLTYTTLINRTCGAADPRDKLYGYWGIVKTLCAQAEISGPALRIDYNPEYTASELCIAFMEELLNETDTLALFCTVTDPPGARSPSLPSWVPDLMAQRPISPYAYTEPPFDATWGYMAPPGGRLFQVSDRNLNCKGVFISQISSILTYTNFFWHSDGLDWTTNWPGILLRMAPRCPYTGQTRVEAFWRTIIANTANRKYPAHWPNHQDGEPFRAWITARIREESASDLTDPKYARYVDDIRDLQALAESEDRSGPLPTAHSEEDLLRQIPEGASRLDDTAADRSSPSPRGESLTLTGPLPERLEDTASLFRAIQMRLVAATERAHLVNAPEWAKVGDTIALIAGCPMPLVLRRSESNAAAWTLIGCAYVHGIMYGEVMEAHPQWEDAVIV